MTADLDTMLQTLEDAVGQKIIAQLVQKSSADREHYVQQWRRALLEKEGLLNCIDSDVISAREQIRACLELSVDSDTQPARPRMH